VHDLDLKGIAVGAGIILLGIVASIAAGWAVVTWSGAPAAGPNGTRPPEIRGPRLETAPRAARERFDEHKRAWLESAGPLKDEPGFGHIPIEEAMKKLAARKLSFQEGGRPVELRRFLGGPPLVVQFGYLGCTNLCPTTQDGVGEALRATGLSAGRDYVALFVSIDPRDEATPQGARPGWHLLTGAAAAEQLARHVGFRYDLDKESGEFAHPAGFYVLAPDGKLSGSFGGVRFDSAAVRNAILGAAEGRKTTGLEGFLLRCFHDPVTGRYSDEILRWLRFAALACVAALAVYAWRRR
jgi:protein SCO1/2